jgi:hypothetical protein
MNDLSRRQFINGVAKTCLGVSAIISADDLLAAEAPKVIPKARHVIFLYMGGGMTHVDTLDPKPENNEVMGETNAIGSSADGIQLGHWLPRTAQQMHNATLVRSLNTNQGAHAQANYLLHTSYQRRGTIVHPTMGAWVSRFTEKLNKTLPSNVKINGGSDVLGAGYFEKKHGPLPLGNPSAGIQNVQQAKYLEQDMYSKRLDIASKFNKNFLGTYPQKQIRAYTDLYDDAIRLMKSEDLQAFDLTKESQATRDEYGDNNFGQGCLLARRLVETGVRFIEVQLGGWDMHNQVFDALETKAATLDAGLSSLMKDLERRGLLGQTLVVLASEFGRSPEVKPGRIGRDHHPSAFSALLAGGGVKQGFVHGVSDERAHYVEEGGVGMEELNATIAHLMGLSVNKTIFSPGGRPFQISHGSQPITEIIT